MSFKMIFFFHEISSLETKQSFPDFWDENGKFFIIERDGEEAGLYAITDCDLGRAEVFLTVFPKFRFNIINKSTINFMMNKPFSYGFTEVWTWTTWKSWIKLMERLDGVERQEHGPSWSQDTNKTWFKRTNI